ncbi:hypothetical protein Pmani_020823 [Petrolisthes manimaculis]|uniref:Uncharacterized protein n=1 Tax=Petrolisthes manimaculis TaxID=1843537 RepID=A0AAE1PFF8_9EUCA|nr:hypothetical protein Pmani_020823 [Petrolisthes manimaculis]
MTCDTLPSLSPSPSSLADLAAWGRALPETRNATHASRGRQPIDTCEVARLHIGCTNIVLLLLLRVVACKLHQIIQNANGLLLDELISSLPIWDADCQGCGCGVEPEATRPYGWGPNEA